MARADAREGCFGQALTDAQFAQLVTTYRRSLFRHAVRRTGDEAAADDAVQETLIRAYRAYERLLPDSQIGPWLHSILSNVCIDEANRRRRESAKVERFSGEFAVSSSSSSVEQQLGLDTDHGSLDAAMASLPDEYREALTKRFVEELTYGELASSVGVSQQNARARVSRARHAMRRAMHGVAVLPITAYLWLRRGRRAAAAFDRGGDPAVTSAAAGPGTLNRMLASLAPTLNNTNSFIASVPPSSGAALGRVAVSLTVAAAATISINYAATAVSEGSPVVAGVEPTVQSSTDPGSTPVVTTVVPAATWSASRTIGSVIDVVPSESWLAPEPAATATSTVVDVTEAPVATTSSTPPSIPLVPAIVATPSSARPAVSTTMPTPTTAPGKPVEEAATTVPSTATNTDAETTTTSTGVPVAATDQPESTEPSTTTTDAAATPVDAHPVATAAPAAPAGGTLQVAVLTVSPAGPRIDLSGAATLATRSGSRAGSMQGRLLIDASVEEDGSQRLDGSVRITLDDGTDVELRLSGFAVMSLSDTGSIRGQFRATGATGDLVAAGSFSGSLGSSLAIALRP